MSKHPLVMMALMLSGCGLLLPSAVAAGVKPLVAQAGQTPQGLTLKPTYRGDGVLAEVVAGSPCWRTSPAQGVSGLGFVADRQFRVVGPVPVAVRVEYLDRGRGSFALAYAAVDSSGRTGLKWSHKVGKQNTGKWRQARLQLTDAYLTRPGGWYLRVDALTDRPGEDEEYVRRVAASLEGLELQLAHPLLGADGQSQSQLVISALLPGGVIPPDGTKVRLSATDGAVTPATTTTKNGVAAATFTAGRQASRAVVCAQCEGMKAYNTVLLWPGTGVGLKESTLIDSFESVDDWVGWPPQGDWNWHSLPQDAAEGLFAAKLTWGAAKLPPPPPVGTIELTKRQYLRGLPWSIRMQVRGDGSEGVLEAILEDATGQCFAYQICDLRSQQWWAHEVPLWQATRYWSGANDGQFHYPVEFRGLRVRPAGPGPGELLVSNLTVTTLAPAQ